MEEVDIIDENNNVIGKTTKQEAHQRGLLHRCVISEIKDKSGKWLMVKQSSKRQDAGQYVSPVGGHVGAGETIEDALKREAFEETGLKDFKFKYLDQKVYDRFVIGRQENHLFILFEIYSSEKLKLNHESTSYASFTDDELKSELKNHPEKFGDAFHFVVKNFFPYLLS